MVGVRSNPEASVALRGPARVHSPWRDWVVPPTQFPSVPWPQALGEVEQRREQFCQEGGETGGKTGVARGDSRLPSLVQHSVRKTVEQSSM